MANFLPNDWPHRRFKTGRVRRCFAVSAFDMKLASPLKARILDNSHPRRSTAGRGGQSRRCAKQTADAHPMLSTSCFSFFFPYILRWGSCYYLDASYSSFFSSFPPTLTHSYSDSLIPRLTHTQPYSYTDLLLLRPDDINLLILRLTHTQTYSYSDLLMLRLTHTQTYSYSDLLIV